MVSLSYKNRSGMFDRSVGAAEGLPVTEAEGGAATMALEAKEGFQGFCVF